MNYLFEEKMLFNTILFSSIKDLSIPQILSGNTSTFAQYTLRSSNRKQMESILKECGIPYCIHYPKALRKQPCF